MILWSKGSPPSFQIFRTNTLVLTNIINNVKMCKRSPTLLNNTVKILINQLLWPLKLNRDRKFMNADVT